jgi:hypothetical protein
MGILSQATEAAKRMRKLLLFVALIYVVSYRVGWYLGSVKSPVQAILITFLLNLTSGAFLSTTLPGIIPLVGALGTIAITLFRGFIIGVTYPEVLASSAAGLALGFGTMILELGAYVFSGAAGINIALAPILPTRYGVQSRWAAFKMAWKDAARIYVIVIILLALGAIWEMTGIFIVLRAP